jgi:adenosylhomocysteine nucleosidase
MAAAYLPFDTLTTSRGRYVPRARTGTIATGDAFVASDGKKREIRSRLDVQAVEMEGAAVAQVCHQWRTPWLVIRSISDNADALAPEEMQAFGRIAAGNAARLAMDLVRLLGPSRAEDGGE